MALSQLPNRLSRRSVLLGASAALTKRSFASPEKPWLLNCVRSTHNAWLAWWNKGGQVYARSIDNSQRYILLQNEGDISIAIKQIKDAAAERARNLVVNFDAGSANDALALAQTCIQLKIYFVTQFNKAEDVHPWAYDPYYVAHIWNDDFQFGQKTAEILVEAIGHRGSIVALEGRSIDRAARERFRGLQSVLAKNPQVQLLDHVDASWEASTAFDLMRWSLARFGEKISGVWSANDSMAIGAIEALRTRGLAGVLPVTGMDVEDEAIASLRSGELTASLIVDPFWCGGMGLSLAYQAAIGKINSKSLAPEMRELSSLFHIVTKANVEKFLAYRESPGASLNWSSPYAPRISNLI
jgi:ribose transport system substrate-binding protein